MKHFARKVMFRFFSSTILAVAAACLSTPGSAVAASAPSITSQPQNQIVLVGSNATFTVVASGQTPLFHQWSFNGTSLTNSARIGGATSPTLTISNVVGYDAGSYQVVVSNSHGSVTSSNTFLTVTSTNHYVDLNNPHPVPPYWNWSTAATNIQNAVDIAASGDQIFVTNGTYRFASRVTSATTNCVVMTNAISLIGVSGPTQTIIDGGGTNRCVYLSGGAQLAGFTLTNGSTAEGGGGVRCASASEVVSNCVLAGNFGGTNSGGGGALFGTLTNCTLAGNSAAIGGGSYGSILNHCIVTANVAGYGCGAENAALNGCLISSNYFNGWGASGGGVMYCTVDNCTLIANQISDYGGGAYSSTLSNCVLIANSSRTYAGGASYCTLYHCVLTANSAVSGGAAFYSTLIGCAVTNNSADWGGGVDSCTLTNCVLNGNSSTETAGGADASQLYNCLVAGNDCSLGAGGAEQSTLVNCTVAGNSSSYGTGGVDASSLTNCIVYFNTGGNYSGSNNMSWCQTTPLPNAGGSNVVIGVSNLSSAPIFVDAAHGNYRQWPGSPGIDAGNNAVVPVAGDLDGNPRIVNGTVDLGAYEFQNSPFIEVQPVSQSVPFGQASVSFSVVAVGPGTLTYQWQFNGTNLSGATNSTLTLYNLQYSQAGNYAVLVMNSYGATFSSTAVLTVMPPPTITLQPVSQTLLLGSNATFTAAVSGGAPLGFQWYFDGNPLTDGGQINGSATSSLTVSDLQFSNSGNYVLIVTNPVGSATSAVAVLTVVAPPSIVQQPTNQTAQWGAAASFSVVATGTAPLNYQWTFNGTNLNGATNDVLTLANLQPSQAGNYAVTITNVIGSVVSSNATLTVNLPPPGVPFIAGFSPLIANPGATVTITGTNFSSVAGSNTVFFGAVQAAVLSASVTNLVVTVPVSATLAPITETVGGLTAYANAPFLPTFAGGSAFTSSSLGPQLVLPAGSGPNKVVIADLDGDGKPDLIVGNDYGDTISLYRNISTSGSLTAASFAPPVNLVTPPGSYSPYGLVVADVDGDGKPDIIVTDYNQALVSVYRNTSTPGSISSNSFATRVDFATGANPQGVEVRDLDGDGKPDLLVANSGSGTVSIFRNTGLVGGLTTNSFAPRVDIPTGAGCDHVAVADLDGDGLPDIVTANTGAGTLSVLHNLSTPGSLTAGSFAPAVNLPVLSEPVQLAIGDLDGDGKPDIIVTFYLPQTTVSVLRNISTVGSLTTNSFAPRVDFPLGGRGHTPALADLDGSGKPDLAVVTELNSLLSVFRNVSTPGSFTSSSFAPRIDFATGYNAWGVALGDLDGDGRPDIVFANTYNNTISIYQNEVPLGGPPVIITPPAGSSVPLNGTVQFTGSVMGQSPLGYQWYFNGTNLTDNGRITGSATGTLSISNALLSDAGNYYFIVTNSLGAATSAVASLTVFIVPPSFAQEPQNQAAVVGSNAVFSAMTSGSQPMAWQWFSNNGPLSDGGRIIGSATTSLTIANVQTNDAINYWLVASNAAGVATSSVVNLTVVLPVVIMLQPSNQTLVAGSLFALTVAVTGTGPFGYQWFFTNAPLADGGRISGSATASLSVSNAQASDTGNYFAVVTNLLTAATSSVATITILVPPVVTSQPAGRSTPLGLSISFTAAASGSAPLAYQWVLNGTNIPGATNTSYSIAAVGTNDLGVYQVVVSNAVGVAVGSNALLTVGPVAAWGYNYYGQCNVPPGLSNVVSIAGGSYYSLASRLDGSIAAWGSVGGYTNSSFTNVTALSANASGALALRADGSVVGSGSENPLLYNKTPVTNAVSIAAGGFGLALRAEGTVAAWGYYSAASYYSLPPVPPGLTHVTAISAGYQHALALRNDGTVAAWGIGAATNVPIGLSNVVAIAAGSGWSLALKSDGTLTAWGTGPGTNVPAGLSNVMAIAAANSSVNSVGTQSGGNVSFAVRSNGTVVAWGFSAYNQTTVPSGLSNVVAVADGALHTLALVNDGTPQILRQPVGGTGWSGRDWTLQVVAAGAASLSFQWLFNGTNLVGATNSTLLLAAIQTNSAGNYQVIVSNALGMAASLPVPLAVMDSAPFLLTQPATNISVFLGNRAALSVAVAGSGPLQYQWQYNGQPIPGANGDTLNFDRAHLANAGSYTLVASNTFGAVTSAVVNLNVQQVVVWGNPIFGVTNMPPGLTNVAAVSANYSGNIALRADGTITVWGDSGYVSTNTVGISNVVEVAAGNNSYLVLKSNGQPYLWGTVSSGLTNLVAAQSNIVSAAFLPSGCALLRADGSVLEVSSSAVTTNRFVTNGIAMESAYNSYLVLRADGTIYSSGNSIPSGVFTNVNSLAANVLYTLQTVALKRDGKVREFPTTLLSTNLSNVIGVAAASGSPLDFAVLQDGSITWAALNGYGNAATNVPYGLANVQTLDAGYVHCLALLSDRIFPPVFLHSALNTSSYVVSSKGSPQWFGETNISHDDVSAAQSAPIGNNVSSSMRMWVAGPITVSFWWKVSSETNHDFLSFSAGGVVLTNISGEVDWQQCTVNVPPGNQILQWTYSKDASGSAGQDTGWVDQLQLIPQPPVIST